MPVQILIAVIVGIAAALAAFFIPWKFFSGNSLSAFKEWLKYAVTMAEAQLGSGTGQLKLRQVYDWFVEKFTWLAKFLSFEEFSDYVDEALEWMDDQLESNAAVAEIVYGTATTGETDNTAAETAEESEE